MKSAIYWFIAQWSQSGNPAWLKALMLVGAVIGAIFMIYKTIKMAMKGV